jgi:hypothetical protein
VRPPADGWPLLAACLLLAAAACRYGRKSNCLLYCLVYSLSCLTKNSPNYHHLMVGRVLGGLATSILFASFESWCITAYRAQRLDSSGLDEVFTNIAFANALTAIISSLFGDFLVTATGNLIAPFNFVPVVLSCCALLIATTWTENYGSSSGSSGGGGGGGSGGGGVTAGKVAGKSGGDREEGGRAGESRCSSSGAGAGAGVGISGVGDERRQEQGGEGAASVRGAEAAAEAEPPEAQLGAASAFLHAARTVLADRRLFLLGMMGALIEATLYIFIFLWTPALELGGSEHGGQRREVRHGVVFGAFMTWNMLGAQLCKRVLGRAGAAQPESLVSVIIAISIAALLLPVRYLAFHVT